MTQCNTVMPIISRGSYGTHLLGEETYEDENTNAQFKSTLNMAGKMITKLTISEGASFNLNVDVTGYDSIEWSVADTTKAKVDADGNVTAVAAGETTVTATVIKEGKVESISIPVVVKPSLVDGYENDTVPVFYYIGNIENTTPYYTMYLSTENMNGAVEGHIMQKVIEGEVIWLERPRTSAFAWLWTATPDKDHALVLMSSSGSIGQYYPLKDTTGSLGSSTGEVSGSVPGKYYVNGNAYNNIVNVGKDVGASWKTDLDQRLATCITDAYLCDGACSNTRWGAGSNRPNADTVPTTVSEMNFISDPIPTITKTVDGVLPTTRKQADYRRYTEGMVAGVGELVYFKVTVSLDRPSVMLDGSGAASLIAEDGTEELTGAITYSNAIMSDTALPGAYLYTKELDQDDGKWDGEIAADNRSQTSNITDALNAPWGADEQTRTIEFYLVYQITKDDIPKFKIDNIANLSTNYKSEYSTGVSSRAADALATITVVGKAMDNVVIDFGQIVEYTGLTDAELKYVTTGTFETKYGTIKVEGVGNVQTESDGDQYYSQYKLTYTPTAILQGPDTIQLSGTFHDNGKEITKVINGFTVYPATTVYYEEGFLFGNNTTGSWKLDKAQNATMTQTFELLGQSTYDTDGKKLTTKSVKVNAYGYDPIYDGSTAGSGGSYATSTAVGDQTVFTFTGTGFELYANSESASGYVTVYSQGSLSKMYMINTKLTDIEGTDITDTTYHTLPIISETDLPHGTYTVYIKHTNAADPIYIDGVRIINTMEDSSIFTIDLEDNPDFFELRDYVLNAIGVENLKDSDYINNPMNDREDKVAAVKDLAGQVYNTLVDQNTDGETINPAVLINTDNTTFTTDQAQNLLDNGPKNELYLYPGQTLVFSFTTNRVMQLGLKSPVGSAKFKLTVDNTEQDLSSLSSTVDMFYQIAGKQTDSTQHTVSIAVSEGVLSVTDLKVCDDPNAGFTALTQEDIEQVMLAMYDLEEETPVEPSEPEVPETPTEPEVPEETTKPTEPAKPGRPGDNNKPGQSNKPGDNRPGNNKPGDNNRPGQSNKPGENNKPGQNNKPNSEKKATLKITFVNLAGKKVGTATLTKTGAANRQCVFTASEINAQAPARRIALWLTPAIVTYGQTVSLVVPVF